LITLFYSEDIYRKELMLAFDVFQAAAFFNNFIIFNYIAYLNIIVVDDADTTLIAGLYLFNIIFKPFEGINLAIIDDHTIADYAHRIIAIDLAVGYITAGNGSYAGNFEYFAHFGITIQLLAYLRREHAFHGIFHFINGVIDDAEEPDIDLFILSHRSCIDGWPYLEANNDGIRGRSQQHIRFGDSSRAGMNDIHRHFFVAEFLQRS